MMFISAGGNVRCCTQIEVCAVQLRPEQTGATAPKYAPFNQAQGHEQRYTLPVEVACPRLSLHSLADGCQSGLSASEHLVSDLFLPTTVSLASIA